MEPIRFFGTHSIYQSIQGEKIDCWGRVGAESISFFIFGAHIHQSPRRKANIQGGKLYVGDE